MACLRKEENAQIIILFGFLIAASLIVLGVLLNTMVYSGQFSSQEEFTFPKNEILDLRLKTLDQVKIAANRTGFKNETIFNEIMDLFSYQVIALHGQHGAYAQVETRAIMSGQNITSVKVRIVYNDMYTDYRSLDMVYDLKAGE